MIAEPQTQLTPFATPLLTCEQDRVLTVHQVIELLDGAIVFVCTFCGLQTAMTEEGVSA